MWQVSKAAAVASVAHTSVKFQGGNRLYSTLCNPGTQNHTGEQNLAFERIFRNVILFPKIGLNASSDHWCFLGGMGAQNQRGKGTARREAAPIIQRGKRANAPRSGGIFENPRFQRGSWTPHFWKFLGKKTPMVQTVTLTTRSLGREALVSELTASKQLHHRLCSVARADLIHSKSSRHQRAMAPILEINYAIALVIPTRPKSRNTNIINLIGKTFQ